MYEIGMTEIAIRLLLAVFIGAVIGFERESTHQSAGLRTNIIVCVAACVITIINIEISYYVIRMGLENHEVRPMLSTDFTRLTAQIISGIGFLGAGSILTTRLDTVAGLTTAATIWGIAGLGIASGMGMYFLAILGCLIILTVLFAVKRIIKTGEMFALEIHFSDRDALEGFYKVFETYRLKATDEDFRMERKDDQVSYHLMFTVYMPRPVNHNELLDAFLSVSDSITEISFQD